ncbi:hypothetical protein LE190_04015 [Massilia oculi]|uniref:DUF4148 domain-containing protein n=1 Tax=Massilia hydrophila TaxID=3044279 RepID=A0ABS7Y7V7_9BURK|nr:MULTISPECIES: hypothetical protein [Massilia]MCA1245003.1 hypothetical protein [Massilia sp. MS-15]MCA1855097.1 hypothetical protein [Massilia oculi]
MNDVFIKNQAGSAVRACGKGQRLAGLVRHGVLACMMACAAAGAMAAGQDRGQPPMRDRYDSRVQDPRFDQRAYEMRDERRDERRQEQAMREQIMREQAMREQGMREEGRRGRMTPDERSDLRRQINEAGKDLYPNARRR